MSMTTADGKTVDGLDQGPFEPIAVIGIAALMPDADTIEQFWSNIVDQKVSIIPIPDGRWPGATEHFWKEGGPGQHTEGFTYAKIGAFVQNYEFDWRRWRQPPGTLPQIDPCQLWAVTVSADALEHAGYDGESKDIDRSRTGVVFANALGGENRNLSNIRVWSNHTKEVAMSHGLPSEAANAFQDEINELTPRVDEDTMPGELANVVSGRVANLLDLQGPNHAMDAACASSMAAILDACRLLQMRQVDTMLAGAADRTMDPATYAKFSAIGALSPSHSTPFDAKANGFVMGEGAGVLLLKRLKDAIDDGDEIYSVIRGIGGSSDGRGKGITAPSQRGQVQAIARAYEQAGYPASSVELVEAHGTSTKVGDATELSTLSQLWMGVGGQQRVAVGSIKSQIGHLKAAAGIAGVMKTVMALHTKTIPPSAGFTEPNPTVDWSNIPFYVPTEPTPWVRPQGHPQRAGVSAFGFGGTNFHVALEAYEPDYHRHLAEHWNDRWLAYSGQKSVASPSAASILAGGLTPTMSHDEMRSIEGGVLLLSATSIGEMKSQLSSISAPSKNFDTNPTGVRLSQQLQDWSLDFEPDAPVRLALVATTWKEFEKRQQLATSSIEEKEKWSFLQAQGVLITDDAPMPSEAKVAHLYPGQGSQYVGMTYDLSRRFACAADVWSQADVTMVDVLGGETLSGFVLRENLTKEESKEAEEKLKQTEYTQPAMLTADLAIEQVFNAFGHRPNMVAGHSLGEYAALMASGILDMDGALRASAARGTEMGSVEIDDRGLMASITAPFEEIESILEQIDGYVISANKNSPKMTVIAGETTAVKEAIARFEQAGYQAVTLATSHAFHSRIVAPANEPLRRFLETLEIRYPSIPITANVDGEFYPNSGSDSKQDVLSKLAPQMASSVEWTKQIETMYAHGARIFIEVGPKRALTVFASQILEQQPHLAMMSNHPKQGGIQSFFTAIGALALAGRRPNWPSFDSDAYAEAFAAGPLEAYEQSNVVDKESTMQAVAPPQVTQVFVESADAMDQELVKTRYVCDVIGKHSPYPSSFCHGAVSLVEGLKISSQSVASIIEQLRREATTDAEYDVSGAKTAGDLHRWVVTPPSSYSISKPKASISTNQTKTHQSTTTARHADPYVVTGISLGLPGMDKVFSDETFEHLVEGKTCISEVSDEYKQRLLDKNIVRLIKGRDGSVNMSQAEVFGDIPQLAGMKGAFDLAEEFGIDPKSILAWDVTTQLALGAGLLALRDAGIPLTPVEQVGKGGLRLITGWEVPQLYRERTGIVFASCFPGLQMAMKHAKTNGDDGEGRFDRRYLFQVLNMGHSQFAQFTGIRGPNTTLNLACASATAAFTVAEDWLHSNRVDRVVIVSSDDVTGDDLWEWIGSGFAASGAAATHNVVEETALPFDKRRNGLILGMGAAAFVVERKSEAEIRGVQPIAEVLGAQISNSAYHGTRLDVEHVAQTVDNFMSRMEAEWAIDRHEIAPRLAFFSHETYTPARGGSAQSEVKALRDTFGASADKMVIANTKGFTGHPMGVGIEDASMFYGMLTGRIPPIANHKEIDPELGNLNLSKGGDYPDLQYGLRFGAGFGSQIALSLVRKWPVQGERIDGKQLLSWLRSLAGHDDVVLRILQKKLVTYVDGENNLHGGIQGESYLPTMAFEGKPIETSPVQASPEPIKPEPPKSEPAPSAVAQNVKAEPVSKSSGDVSGDVVQTVIDVVVKHTGYPADFVELDQDLEGELGIDTVKQAEIMAEIRSAFSLPVDEDFILSDHPTLNHMIEYIGRMGGSDTGSSAQSVVVHDPNSEVAPVQKAAPEPTTQGSEPVPQPTQSPVDGDMAAAVVEVVVKHTGYPEDFIELDQDLEGELGIDTVKQAEIMADIRSGFDLPVDEDFVLADHPTLNHMIGYIQKMKGGSVPQPNAPSEPTQVQAQPEVPPQTVSQPTEPIVSSADPSISPTLIQVVVKHTGYPEDFIELDQDLEGELGIDTVKQAEIMAEIRTIFELPVDEDFILADHPTLNHFIAYITKMKGGGQSQVSVEEDGQSPPGASPVPSKTTSYNVGCRRWQVEIEDCPGLESPQILSDTMVITDDDWGIAEAMCKEFDALNLESVRIGFESGIRDPSVQQEQGRTVYRADPAIPQHVQWVCSQLAGKKIGGLFHLSPMKLASETMLDDAIPSSQIALSAHGWFGLLKGCGELLTDSAVVVSVTAMDGRHGNHGERFNAIQCAASGVTKSYAFERPELRCRALDIHPELMLEAPIAAQHIIEDVSKYGGEVEIGLDRDHRRWTLVAFAEDLVEDTTSLSAADCYIVSGGGSGVTAASVIGLARASQGSGAHFILLGRSSLIEETQTWLEWSEEQLSERKMALREELVTGTEDGKVTMVEWNSAWQKFTRSRDVYLTLSHIHATGNTAEYQAMDVTDIGSLEAFGSSCGRKITGIIHGAGLEDSKLVTDKSHETFDNVVRVKVDGWRALLGAVHASGVEHPSVACCFTSVAGRFGNGGQTDYAAANSVLDAEMARITASGHGRGIAIAWTGWQDIGMATRGSIEAVFEAAGIETLSVETGVSIFVDEVLRGGKRRVLGCGSLGMMDKFNAFREPPLKLPAEMAALLADPERFPFIDKVISYEQGVEVTTQCTLSTEEYPFLIDHAIEGVPYHPGVMALETFAQNALLVCPHLVVAGFAEVEFGLPVKLMKGPLAVQTIARLEKSDDGVTMIACKMVSDLTNSKGEVFGQREHHVGKVRMVEKGEVSDLFARELDQVPYLGTPPAGKAVENASFIYSRYFHGPRFQSHGGVIGGCGTSDAPGIDGIALMRHQLPNDKLFAREGEGEPVFLEALPMLIEAGFQNAGLVAMEFLRLSSLPIGIEWSTMLRVPEKNESLRVRSLLVDQSDDGVTTHQVLIVGEDDAPVLALKNLRLKSMAPIDDAQSFEFER